MTITFRNQSNATASKVKLLRSGRYSVTLWDTTSCECLPCARHYVSIKDAIDTAKIWAGVQS